MILVAEQETQSAETATNWTLQQFCMSQRAAPVPNTSATETETAGLTMSQWNFCTENQMKN